MWSWTVIWSLSKHGVVHVVSGRRLQMKRCRSMLLRGVATRTVATPALVTPMLFSGPRCLGRCMPCGMPAATTGGIAKSNLYRGLLRTDGVVGVVAAEGVEAPVVGPVGGAITDA